jgi:hypothetical protein
MAQRSRNITRKDAMPPIISDTIHLRSRAREMRRLADKLTDPEEKRLALQMVEDYEKLARLAEARTARPSVDC